MKIKILDNFSYQTYPIVEDMIDVSEKDLIAIQKRTKCFDIKNQSIIPYDNSIEIAANKQYEIFFKINTLKNQLKETDYQAIKYAEGQISEKDYLSIKIERQSWRDEINKLEAEMK